MLYLKHCLLWFHLILIVFCSSPGKIRLGVKLTKVIQCPQPVHKMDKDSPIRVRSFIRITGKDSSLIDINFNVSRAFGPIFLSLRVYQVQKDDKLKMIFKTDQASCKNPLTFQMIRVIKGPMDKNCMVEKGSFWVRDLDIDKFSWILTKAAVAPGQYIYELEYISANTCLYCSRMFCELFVKNKN